MSTVLALTVLFSETTGLIPKQLVGVAFPGSPLEFILHKLLAIEVYAVAKK